MRAEPHHSAEDLAARIRREPRGKIARRLTAIRLALLGQVPEQIGPQVLLSARQVRTWINRYNRGGLDGLLDRKGRGRKGPLSAEQGQRLKQRLQAGPTEADGVCSLRGADVRRILEEEFGVLRCLQAVYGLMHRLGLEPLRPRPRHPNGDPARQEEFKKTSLGSSPRSPPPTPARRSRRGSRTRPASGRRAP
jgi:transposase